MAARRNAGRARGVCVKRWLLVLALVVVALGAAGAALRFLVDWDSVQQELLARAGRSVGLQISFDGAVELRFLPRPTLRIEGVRIGPAAGQGDQTIVAAERVEIAPSLIGLVGGKIEIEAVAMSGVSVALERDASGNGNWQALLDALSQGGGEGAAIATEIRIARGTVFLQDRAAGREETIGNIAGRIAVPGEIGSYELDLAFFWRGVALSLTGLAAQPDAEGAAPFDLALRDADLGLLKLNGRANLTALRVEQGRFHVESGDAGKLLARLGSAGTWPTSMRRLQLDGRWAIDAAGATFDDLRLRLGDASASGAVLAKFGAKPRFDVALNLPQLALDPLLAAFAVNPQQQPAAAAAGWPSGISASLALEIGAASYRGSAVRGLKLDAALADGKMTLQRFEGLAPGGTAIRVSGEVANPASGPRLQGRLEAQSDDLRAFLGWVGTDLRDIAATRLRRAQLTAGLAVDGRGIVLDRAEIEIDSSTATGRVEIPWDDKSDIGVALAVDRLDIDAYRTTASPAAGKPAAAPRAVSGTIAIAQATYDSKTLHEVTAEGRWAGKRADLRSFAAKAPGAATLRGSGKIEGLGGSPGFSGRIELASEEPGALVRWLGFQPSPGLDALKQFSVAADLTASERAIAATGIEAELGDLRFTGTSGIDLAGDRPKLTANLKIPSWRVPWEQGGGPVLDAPRPVDFSWLTGFDAELRIAADQLHALHYTLADARAVATIREQTIELRRLTGRAYDGWLRARGSLDASGDQVRYTASVEAGDLAIEPLLVDAAGFGELAGKLYLAAEVKGAGRTDVELIRSADGTARVVATDGLMRGFDMGRIAKRVAGLENITDIGKLIDAVEQGGETRYTLVQGELSIASGVARFDNVQMQIEGGSGKANGWVDLAASTVSLRGEVSIDEAPGKPTIGIVVRGPLEEPEREIKTGEISRYIQSRINAAAMGKTPPPEAEIQAAVPHTIELPKPPRRFRRQATQ